jgi:hypothetical protein
MLLAIAVNELAFHKIKSFIAEERSLYGLVKEYTFIFVVKLYL